MEIDNSILLGSGIHPWKPGMISWIEIHEKNSREIMYEPSYEEIEKACIEHGFHIDKTILVIASRDKEVHGFFFEGDKVREHQNMPPREDL